MKKILIAAIAVGGMLLGSGAHAAADAAKAKQLANKYYCLTCHKIDEKSVGPAYTEVAKKYKGDQGAEAKLAAKVKNGGSGVWGGIPMPPNSAVPEADIKTIVEWVLSLQ